MTKSKNMGEIERLCRRFGQSPEKVYKLSKEMLSSTKLALFSRRTFGDDTFAITVPNNNREQIRAEFLKLTESGDDDIVERLLELEGVINGTDWLNHIVRDVLIAMENFTESGERYCKIIENCFLSNNPVMDEIFMTELGLSRTSYYCYKKESIMLFGLLLWHNAYTAVFEDGRTSYKEDGHGITPKRK